MYKQLALPLALAASLLAPRVARADQYLYSVHDAVHGQNFADDFTYLSQSFITSGTTFTPDTYTVTNRFGMEIIPTSFTVTIDPISQGGGILTTAEPYFLSFTSPLGEAFFTVGHHSIFNGEFTLDITDIPSAPPTVTPEPGSLALLGTGMLGVFGTLRRRFFATTAQGK